MGGDDDDRRFRVQRLDPLEDRVAIQPRHLDVGDDHGRDLALEEGKTGRAVGGGEDAMPGLLQMVFVDPPQRIVVIDEEDGGRHRHGRFLPGG